MQKKNRTSFVKMGAICLCSSALISEQGALQQRLTLVLSEKTFSNLSRYCEKSMNFDQDQTEMSEYDFLWRIKKSLSINLN